VQSSLDSFYQEKATFENFSNQEKLQDFWENAIWKADNHWKSLGSLLVNSFVTTWQKSTKFLSCLLGYDKSNENLIIPYEEHVKIQVLQELQELLKKFNFSEKKSQEVQSSFQAFFSSQRTGC
jgi:phenylalanyl-tRNA synthetase alpha subunit